MLESEAIPTGPIEHLRNGPSSNWRRSTPAGAARFNARSAPSSTSRARNRGAVRRTTSRRRSASTGSRASRISSSPTTTSARNKDWEAIFAPIIALRERDNMNVKLMIQVDTLCHKIPNFIDKAVRAGTNRALIGLESINAANLLAAKQAPEQDHRVSQDAAGLEKGRHHHGSPATSSAFRSTRRISSARTSRSSRTSCRSTSLSSSASRRCR